MNNYESFLQRKAQLGSASGFTPTWMPDFLFDFQSYVTEWGIRQGRPAFYEDCGLGKTVQELVWGENVVRHTNKRVLLAAPLAVTAQTIEEAEKFGIEAHVSRDGKPKPNITVTNYERLHLFDSADYTGMICDESSILKNFDGKTKALVTEFMRRLPYRLLCTATAAPNDYIELGTSSEALGELGYIDMLNRFFKNDQNTIKPMAYRNKGQDFAAVQERVKWRFKGHAEVPFWRWVSSWARAMRKPSDLGFDDGRFELPPLVTREHVIQARTLPEGFLFDVGATGLREERDESKRTLTERCEKAASLAQGDKPVALWCNLNPEGDRLAKLLPDFVQVSGSDSIEAKEEAFTAFSKQQVRGIILKPKIGAWGLNWQHCAHAIVFPTHSYEQLYQLTRRFWRFGQTQPVTIDQVTTESGQRVLANLQRKAAQADRMFAALVEHMREAQQITRSNGFHKEMEIPKWLT